MPLDRNNIFAQLIKIVEKETREEYDLNFERRSENLSRRYALHSRVVVVVES